MTTVNHTAGQWFAVKQADSKYSRIESNVAGAYVGEVRNCDANLVAAAPELLEALLACWESRNDPASLGTAMYAVRAAIEKATAA